jgi:hypothetical protein
MLTGASEFKVKEKFIVPPVSLAQKARRVRDPQLIRAIIINSLLLNWLKLAEITGFSLAARRASPQLLPCFTAIPW